MEPLIVVTIPVLSRPQNAAPVIESLLGAATVKTRAIFVCTPGDDEQIEACRATEADVMVVTWDAGAGDFAKKTNAAYRATESTHVFTGADDLRFEPDWDREALNWIGPLGVCGTNDKGNPLVMAGKHSTHSLVLRAYVDAVGATFLDGPGVVLHEGYDHQYIDNELVHAAQMRKQWAFSRGPAVEHLHPFWSTAYGHPKSQMDDTYVKAQRAGKLDARLYAQRRRRFMVGLHSSRVATQRIVT